MGRRELRPTSHPLPLRGTESPGPDVPPVPAGRMSERATRPSLRVEGPRSATHPLPTGRGVPDQGSRIDDPSRSWAERPDRNGTPPFPGREPGLRRAPFTRAPFTTGREGSSDRRRAPFLRRLGPGSERHTPFPRPSPGCDAPPLRHRSREVRGPATRSFPVVPRGPDRRPPARSPLRVEPAPPYGSRGRIDRLPPSCGSRESVDGSPAALDPRPFRTSPHIRLAVLVACAHDRLSQLVQRRSCAREPRAGRTRRRTPGRGAARLPSPAPARRPPGDFPFFTAR